MTLGPEWQEFIAKRHEREDEPLKKRFARWAHLGCGHTHNEVMKLSRRNK